MKKLKEFRSRKGFTLVELIIYVGILSVLITVLTDILVSTFNTQLSTQSASQVAQDGRYIYTRMTYDINRAESVSIPANLGDTSNSLQLVISGTTYTYALSGGNLQLTSENSPQVLNSIDTTISNLQFTRIGNAGGKHTFRINFTISGKINFAGRYDTKSFQTTAGLR